jgi:hypothetical protein
VEVEVEVQEEEEKEEEEEVEEEEEGKEEVVVVVVVVCWGGGNSVDLLPRSLHLHSSLPVRCQGRPYHEVYLTEFVYEPLRGQMS